MCIKKKCRISCSVHYVVWDQDWKQQDPLLHGLFRIFHEWWISIPVSLKKCWYVEKVNSSYAEKRIPVTLKYKYNLESSLSCVFHLWKNYLAYRLSLLLSIKLISSGQQKIEIGIMYFINYKARCHLISALKNILILGTHITDVWLFCIQNLNKNWIRILFFLSFQCLMIAEKKVTIYGQQKVKSNGRLRIQK